MERVSKRMWIRIASGVICVLLFIAPGVSARERKAHPYRRSILDMPVSLEVGTIRTPEFSPRKPGWHFIMIQIEKPKDRTTFQQMTCMLGTTLGGHDLLYHCSDDDPLLRVAWIVRNEDQIVLTGVSTTSNHAAFTNENIFKFLGEFPTETGKKYVLEVTFTKDGTPLNVANPHLIVTRIGDE